MKTTWTILTVAAAFISIASTPAMAQQPQGPKLVPAAYHTGYLPAGFDSNDNVQIVGEGTFANTCFKPARVKAKVDYDKKIISVQPYAYQYDGICLQMLVDYNQVIDLGVLKAGTYKVVQQQDEANVVGELTVRSTSRMSPDDFPYAPVSQAYVRSRDGVTRLTVTGEFSMSCLKVVDMVVNVQSNVITVQPITNEAVATDCKPGKFPFEKTVDVQGAASGRYLLHVRSLNGKAINNLVDIP